MSSKSFWWFNSTYKCISFDIICLMAVRFSLCASCVSFSIIKSISCFGNARDSISTFNPAKSLHFSTKMAAPFVIRKLFSHGYRPNLLFNVVANIFKISLSRLFTNLKSIGLFPFYKALSIFQAILHRKNTTNRIPSFLTHCITSIWIIVLFQSDIS